MIKQLAITMLIDDHCGQLPQLFTEHGLSLWIEADEKRILFDTGQSDCFSKNASMLGIDLNAATALVLSHGHYDHTGGVFEILNKNHGIGIYCHGGIFNSRYSGLHHGAMKHVGISKKISSCLHAHIDKIHWIPESQNLLSDDIGITGPIPRTNEHEKSAQNFYFDPDALRPDPVEDDLALWFKTVQGLVIVTGCCHSGIINTIEFIRSQNPAERIYMIIGGFHMMHASAEQIEMTLDYLQSIAIKKIIPCHCTGNNAIASMQHRFGNKVTRGYTGARFSIYSFQK